MLLIIILKENIALYKIIKQKKKKYNYRNLL